MHGPDFFVCALSSLHFFFLSIFEKIVRGGGVVYLAWWSFATPYYRYISMDI